jgi:phage terminase large subunit
MTTARLELPPKLLPVFAPKRGAVRYRGAWGGRGSAKSFNFAKMAAVWGVIDPLRILATRELQESIKESFHAELKNAIASEPWLAAAYDVGIDYIRGRVPGRTEQTEFLFKGLRHNIGSIKSMAQIDLCIVEEAEDVPEASWLALEPTIRAHNSEIWVIWNPRLEGSPVDTRFRDPKNPDPTALIVELNYPDNPWFPPVLEQLRAKQKRTLDAPTYRWIWDGAYYKLSKAMIFSGKFAEGVRTPTDDWGGPYYGLDFGFANDPTAGVKVWVSPDNREVYIEAEAGQVGLELDDTGKFLADRLPGITAHAVYADNARPESISYLSRKPRPGDDDRVALPRIEGVSKGPGSVEDGIEFIKSFEVVTINPACVETIKEFERYSFKVDRLTGEVLPVIIDSWNHYIDALRYALERVMRANESFGMMLPSRIRKGLTARG